VVDSARLKPEKPAAAAEESWVVATDLAEALARNGTPFHKAHQIAGRLVLHSVQTGKLPAQWTAQELVAFDAAFTPEMIGLMNPSEGMKTRVVPGGTSPQSVANALAEAAVRLAAMRR